MGWAIYTHLMSSMLAIQNNRKNLPIINQICDILAVLHNQGKQIILCKIPAHIGIKGKEEANKAEKQAIDMPWDDQDKTTSYRLRVEKGMGKQQQQAVGNTRLN